MAVITAVVLVFGFEVRVRVRVRVSFRAINYNQSEKVNVSSLHQGYRIEDLIYEDLISQFPNNHTDEWA